MLRFDEETTIQQAAEAIRPELERILSREEMTEGQEWLGATILFAFAHPDSQTASDLLYWLIGQTPGGAVEGARATGIEEWIAEEDRAAFEAFAPAE